MTNRRKKFVANALALVVSSVPYGMGIEMGLWRMTFIQSISSRFNGMWADFLYGGPYGVYWEWLVKKFRYQEGQWFKYWLVSSFAFATGQLWLYLLLLALTWLWVPVDQQATWDQVWKACVTLVVTAPVGDFLFRWCQKFFYWLLGVEN